MSDVVKIKYVGQTKYKETIFVDDPKSGGKKKKIVEREVTKPPANKKVNYTDQKTGFPATVSINFYEEKGDWFAVCPEFAAKKVCVSPNFKIVGTVESTEDKTAKKIDNLTAEVRELKEENEKLKSARESK